MKRIITALDIQKNDFVNSLYNEMRNRTRKAIEEHKKIASRVVNYLEDGMEDNECIELLILDGFTREAAKEYIQLAKNNMDSEEDGLYEYSFSFEDNFGKLVNSHEISRIIKASSDEEAWQKAEEFVNEDTEYDAEKILSVERIV